MAEKKTSAEKKEGIWKYNLSIIKSNKEFFLLLFAGLFVIYSFLYGLWIVPLIGFGISRMSAVGISDYLVVFGASAFISLFVTLWRYEKREHAANSNGLVGAAGGGIAAVIGGICPACQGVVLLAFGTTILNIPAAFLVPYLGVIKTLSLGLLMLAVYLKADSVYTKTCKVCLISSSKGGKH